MPVGRQGEVPCGANLLEAARSLGVELESICGGKQTCAKCQVVVQEGRFPKLGITSAADHLTPPTEQEEALLGAALAQGRRLACAAEILGDLLVEVPPESQAHKQIIAKAATERAIPIEPAVRQLYVEVQPARLGDRRGDWERVQAALAEQWDLHGVAIEPAILPDLHPALEAGQDRVTLTLWHERLALRVQPGYAEGAYGLAVDIGSTTIAAHLCDLRTGQVLATQAAMNPQVRYGEDLMSRISYANQEPQGLARLQRAVLRTLNELAQAAAEEAGILAQDILEMVAVGNTVMHHILLGIHPRPLGGAPFSLIIDSPLDLPARDLGLKLHPAARLHTLPLIAGHVGADNVAVILAEAPHLQDEIHLVIDVGTNAEIVLGNKERLIVASSPTGPAFEGAQITHGQRAAPGAVERVRINPQTLEPRVRIIGFDAWFDPRDPPPGAKATGICGSGIVEAVAEMFLAGIINHQGHFLPEAAERSPRLRFHGRTGEYVLVDAPASASGTEIVVTQNDVRAIQLAKAALYTGAKLLMAELGVEKVDRILLAGAFGTYLSPRHAMILGMIPDCDLERVVAVGNAAGDGARIALLNRSQRAEAARLARWVDYLETPLAGDFQEQFVAALGIPHSHDPFPHLAGMLPKRLERARKRPNPNPENKPDE